MKFFDRWRRVFKSSARVGARGERVAAGHLRRAGYRVLGRNLRNRFGEVDLLVLAPDRRTVVVVEVKSGVPPIGTTSKRELVPEAHVTGPKQRRLVALACQIARRYRLTRRPIRFDVVGVDLLLDGPPVVRHHIGAFQSHV